MGQQIVSDACLRFAGFEIDEAEARLRYAYGRPIPLAPKPFAVLCTLARSPHRLLTKHELLNAVWGHQYVADSVLKTAISEVRAALGDDPKQPRYIETIARRGYRFIARSPGMFSPAATDGDDPGEAAQSPCEALTALCRADAAVANLIRAVAASLESEQLSLGYAGAPTSDRMATFR